MMTGFAQAGALWSAFLKDPITINIRVGASALSPGILGHTDIFYDPFDYTNVRTALVNDRLSADDFTSTNALQAAPVFSMLINRTANNPNGAIIQREGPIHISNVKVVERGTTEKEKRKKKAA